MTAVTEFKKIMSRDVCKHRKDAEMRSGTLRREASIRDMLTHTNNIQIDVRDKCCGPDSTGSGRVPWQAFRKMVRKLRVPEIRRIS